MEAGHKVGTFTSPEITNLRETICVNKEWIPYSVFTNYLKLIKIECEAMSKEGLTHPTRFEVLTALMFLYFKDQGCSIVVLEAGMGGRLDATNVISNPLCCVITAISLDHTSFLGNTLEKIAYEKSGIIKPMAPVVMYPPNESVYKIFQKVCKANNTTINILDTHQIKLISYGLSGQVFSYKDYVNLKIPLLGEHQIYNAALAIEVIYILRQNNLSISDESIYTGLAQTVWPGRFEKLLDNPLFFIDGAHNLEGAKALTKTINTYLPSKKLIFILGLLKDKDYNEICKLTAPLASHIFLIKPSNPRALNPYILEKTVRQYCPHTTVCDSIDMAKHLALQLSTPDDVIIAFGSLYFIGKIASLLKDNE